VNVKLSIITVCYNAEKEIEKTINSVLAQSYSNYEFIVIDGKSKDRTLDILEDYNNCFLNKKINFKVFSELDNGIYDAMNKGIKKAQGEWLLFLNSGDTLFDENVLNDFMDNKYSKSIKLIYGNTNLIYSSKKSKVIRNNNLNRFKLLFYTINHQSIFFNYKIFERFGFYNTKYKIIADKDIILKAYFNKKIKLHYIDKVVANFDMNGLSNNYQKLLKEKYSVTKEHFSFIEYYILIIFENLRKIKLRMIGK